MHHLQLPAQANNYDCGLFVLAYQRATQAWKLTHLLTPRSSMDLRMVTLKATLRRVTQTEVTELRHHLRHTLHQHCTIHTPAPPGFRCHASRAGCTCLQAAQSQLIYIAVEQNILIPDSPAPEPIVVLTLSPAADQTSPETNSSIPSARSAREDYICPQSAQPPPRAHPPGSDATTTSIANL